MTTTTVDAVVIGSGPNGLTGAIALADAGWEVLVLEGQPTWGGAVRSAEVAAPGYVTDLFSAFYPLAAASPVVKSLHLEDHGLSWVHAPEPLVHLLPDGRTVTLSRDLAVTAASVETFGAGDGDAWAAMVAEFRQIRDPLLDALFTPFPPVRAGLGLIRRLGTAGFLDLVRMLVLPVRRLGQERFTGDGGPLLLTGNAMHADVPADAAGSAVMGWILAMLAQDVGFPVPLGGAGGLTDAMVGRLRAAGGDVRTGQEVTGVLVGGGRAMGVRTADGSLVRARRAVLADTSAPALFGRLLPPGALPAGLARRMQHFQPDTATLKVNWALDRPIGWSSPDVARGGTVHLGSDLDGFVELSSALSLGRAPLEPFCLLGQMTTTDATRSPAGTESAWAYTHVPQGASSREVDTQLERVEALMERSAPGFAGTVVGRHVQRPDDLESSDANLVGGSINGGTSAIHQQLFFRPVAGLGRPETPVQGLYLASAAAHPGGGVHGACGWNAARAALADHSRAGGVKRALVRTAWDRLLP